jgi:hypothetical protein
MRSAARYAGLHSVASRGPQALLQSSSFEAAG